MRIGILTGGGDCPGLNAVIRAVVRTCDVRYGSRVVGFQDGWRGLLENRRIQLANDDRNDRLLAKGGTRLGTARVHPEKLRAGLDQIKGTLDDNGIDVLIPIGGEGTLTAAHWLSEENVPVVGVPHLEGHLLAPALEPGAPDFPFVALQVSGGHTMLVDVRGVGRYRILGETQDDAVL